jgi:Pyruvate/2-oxoacid:ferredoxin oxidoreductase delta subunit
MPAQPEEVAEAREEGIAVVDGAMLAAVAAHADGGVELTCVRVRFVPGAVRGQFTVTQLPGTAFTLAADAIVPSIGQDPDLAPFGDALGADGALLAVDRAQATGAQRVFAGGDVASMARFVTEAIGMGKRAAQAIDRLLSAGAEDPPPRWDEPVVPLAAIATYYHPAQPRAAERRRDVGERLGSDAEVQLGLEVAQALAETTRCYSCGTCIHCDNCVIYCPDLAVKPANGGYVVLGDYCKGCGICVVECPTGSMKMVEESR